MRILSCYIAGFGKFVSCKIDFTANLTVIKQDNGWGKTTLADFIRCMFFGLDGGRTRAIENNDRAHYAPWQGGAFGGTLTFTVGNQTFRVERAFGKTPAQDVARVYDGNNMQSFAFGEKAEKLGEMLFGVDSEGYRKSVYVPQGEIHTGGLPDDMKNRLLALLSTGGANAETGSEIALEKLDAADRALRSKRAPKKGKLDLIDERLEQIARGKLECDSYSAQITQLRARLAETERALAECTEKLRGLYTSMESVSRQSELAVKQQAYREAQARRASMQTEMDGLAAFFGEVDPLTVNVDGIKTAVTDYYALKAKIEEAEPQYQTLRARYKDMQALKTQAETCEKILAAHGNSEGAGTRRNKKGKKIIPPKNKYAKWVVMGSLIVAIVGAILVDIQLIVGLSMLGVGLLGMLIMFLMALPRREKPSGQNGGGGGNGVLDEKLEEVKAELVDIERRLASFPQNLPETVERLGAEREAAQAELAAREQSIRKFLQNFRFEEIYDYRAAVALLQDRINAYKNGMGLISEQEKRMSEFSENLGVANSSETLLNADMGALKAQIEAYERHKQELTETRAKAVADIENLTRAADKNALLSEERALSEEKARLEKRCRAIRMAREFLIRAKENMAARYLIPVTEGTKKYLALLDANGGAKDGLRFSAEGIPLCEEGGAFRELGYYSTGSKELIGLCMRVALADAVFRKELPVLVLDDPLVNLDDSKTEKAKNLIRELAKRYQIIYLTCKNERKI